MPLSGLGVLACLFAATALATGLVIWADRRATRRQGPVAAERPPDAPREPMSALTAVGLTLAGVVVAIYVVLILASSWGGR